MVIPVDAANIHLSQRTIHGKSTLELSNYLSNLVLARAAKSAFTAFALIEFINDIKPYL